MVMAIDSDDESVRTALVDLAQRVERCGGYASPKAVCVARNGHLRIHASPDLPSDAPLIYLPRQCLPRPQVFKLSISDGYFQRAEPSVDVTPDEHGLLESLLTVFNACDKPEFWIKTCPWIVLNEDSEILDKLICGRVNNSTINEQRMLAAKGQYTELFLKTFLQSRMIHVPTAEDNKNEPTLMPFVEFINHRIRAPGYQFDYTDHAEFRGIWTYAHRTDNTTNECFVTYGILDALDTYLLFGFMGTEVTFVNSISTTIDIGDNFQVHIGGEIGTI